MPTATLLSTLPAQDAERVMRLAAVSLKHRQSSTDKPLWVPMSDPQKMAYYSEADELLYGGSAGGGKTDLLLGLATTAHSRSIIFRREYPQLKAIIDRSHELLDGIGQYSGQQSTWRLPGGKQIEFGAVQYSDDVRKYQGRPHDLLAFDELANFSEFQYTFLSAWARTTVPGQRVRRVSATNPPTSTDGEWIIKRWAPWLDGQHPRPAVSGELRWYATVDGQEVEVEDGTPFQHKGETVTPSSRTFIPATLADNTFLADSGYAALLQSMPEPLRSQLLYGDFGVGMDDDPWQVIPTEWVRQAQARWTENGRPRDEKGAVIPLTCIGADIARGGKDKTVLQKRYANWYDIPLSYPGTTTPNGSAAAGLVLQAIAGDENAQGAYINVDVIGVGSSAYDSLSEQDADVIPINFASGVLNMDRTGTMRFVNMRAWAYWSLREALDPERGDGLAIPPIPELLSDLCSARWQPRISGIQIEDKDEIRKRIGRSPDMGDAFALASLPNMSPRLS